jgi:hypothetical protein
MNEFEQLKVLETILEDAVSMDDIIEVSGFSFLAAGGEANEADVITGRGAALGVKTSTGKKEPC